MPLSDYERRQLEQIEHQLAADSPQLSVQLTRGRPVNLLRRCAARGGAMLPALSSAAVRVPFAVVVGLALVVLGLRLGDVAAVLLAVCGYVLIVVVLDEWLVQLRRRRHRR